MSESEEKNEVFRGHLEECVAHFGSKIPKSSRQSVELKRPMADFCGVTVATVTRWIFDPKRLPIGDVLIKLMCFLDISGYKVIELERMPKTRRNFAELIGFGLLTMHEAAKIADYKKVSRLFQYIHGKQGSTKDKEKKMWDTWKERREELETKKSKLRQEQPSEQQKEREKIEPKKTLEPAKPKHTHSGQLPAVINIMEGLLVLLDENSKIGLEELRPATNTILLLSARLSTLSSKLITLDQQEGGN